MAHCKQVPSRVTSITAVAPGRGQGCRSSSYFRASLTVFSPLRGQCSLILSTDHGFFSSLAPPGPWQRNHCWKKKKAEWETVIYFSFFDGSFFLFQIKSSTGLEFDLVLCFLLVWAGFMGQTPKMSAVCWVKEQSISLLWSFSSWKTTCFSFHWCLCLSCVYYTCAHPPGSISWLSWAEH